MAGHVARMKAVKTEDDELLGRPRRRWQKHIRTGAY